MAWKTLEYAKKVDVGHLTDTIMAAGYNTEAPPTPIKFGGCVCHFSIPQLLVYVYEDITPAEEAEIDTIVDNEPPI